MCRQRINCFYETRAARGAAGLAVTYQRLGRQDAAEAARNRFTRVWLGSAAPELARL
jgi:hypothetical protein